MFQETKVEGTAVSSAESAPPESPIEPREAEAESVPQDTLIDPNEETQADSSQIGLPPNLMPKSACMTAKKASSPAGPPKLAAPKASQSKAKPKVENALPPSVYQRIYRAPPDIKQRWKDHFSKLPPDDETRQEFIEELMSTKASQYGASQYFKTQTQIAKTSGNEKLGRWWTYKEMCDSEGEVQTKSMAQFKSVPMRRNPRLNPKANIPYPEDQEFWKAHTWTKDSTMTTKSQTKESDQTELDEEEADQFDKMVDAIDKMEDSKKEEESESKTDVAPIDLAGMKEAMTAAKKVHSEWERKKRDFEGNIESSKINENTKGCKFEKDLILLIEEGTKQDTKFLNLEKKFNAKAKMEPSDVWVSHLFWTSVGRELP